MPFLKAVLTIVFLMALTFSCGVGEGNRFKSKPKALGKMNEIVVVVDDDLWNGILGDTLSYYLGGYYPLTPKPEPIFDLRFMPLKELNASSLKRQLRTYLILANLSDVESEMTKFVKSDLGEQGLMKAQSDPSFRSSVGTDKWAYGQILIYLFDFTIDGLANTIVDNFEGISARVNNHDRRQLYQSAFPRGTNQGISALLSERFSSEIEIPFEYQIIQDAEEFNKTIWVRKDTESGYANIVFHEYPYTDQGQLLKNSIRDRFNTFGKLYVSSPEPNSYLAVNDIDLPILEFDRTIGNRYGKECRGIWEMENDFMGGPFMSYVIVNQDEGRFLQVDGFIYDPGSKKRDLMQQIDLIVKSIKY